MSEATGTPPDAIGQLEQEAARWCSVMHGPDADKHRLEFEAWLRRGALHRHAYNRMDEVFLLGAKLPPRLLADNIGRSPSTRTRRMAAVLATLALLAFVAAQLVRRFAWQNGAGIQLFDQNVQLRLSTLRVSSETFRLADGSVVTLAPESEVAVDYNDRLRHLRLARGRSRFDVAPQTRPFIVEASGGTVTARGTSFEVALLPERGFHVHVRAGSVDVASRDDGVGDAPQLKHLSAGDGATFSAGVDEQIAVPGNATDHQPSTIGELVTASNRLAGKGPTLQIADPALLAMRLGGEFRTYAPAVVAERLALMLDLKVHRGGGRIVLERQNR